MIRRWAGYPGPVWFLALPIWLGVLMTVVVPYASDVPWWLLTGCAASVVALRIRPIRSLALVAPAFGVWARSPDASLASQLTAVIGLMGAVVVLALLDGWDLAGPAPRRTASAKAQDTGPWITERVRALTGPLLAAAAIALVWAGLAVQDWYVGGWGVALTPAALAVAVSGATYELWWRPRRDSNPRPPP